MRKLPQSYSTGRVFALPGNPAPSSNWRDLIISPPETSAQPGRFLQSCARLLSCLTIQPGLLAFPIASRLGRLATLFIVVFRTAAS